MFVECSLNVRRLLVKCWLLFWWSEIYFGGFAHPSSGWHPHNFMKLKLDFKVQRRKVYHIFESNNMKLAFWSMFPAVLVVLLQVCMMETALGQVRGKTRNLTETEVSAVSIISFLPVLYNLTSLQPQHRMPINSKSRRSSRISSMDSLTVTFPSTGIRVKE